jgi:hypothetical protein
MEVQTPHSASRTEQKTEIYRRFPAPNDSFIDLNDGYVWASDKEIGTKEGGIYEKEGTLWYVKNVRELHVEEFLASRVLQYLMPNSTSPVFFIKGQPGWVASKEIKGFRPKFDVVTDGKVIKDGVKLAVALDFVNYIDRLPGNLGYIIDDENPQELLAACVDYDLGFRFFWPEHYQFLELWLTRVDDLPEAIEALEDFTSIAQNKLLDYVDVLVAEANEWKTTESKFDTSKFHEIVRYRLEKMAKILEAARQIDAFFRFPPQEKIEKSKLEELNNFSKLLFKEKPTLLHLAISKDRIDLVNLLINSGADLDERDSDHQTPVLMATKKDLTEIVMALLSAGANPNKVVLDRPIYSAIKNDNVPLCERLTESHPDKTWMLIEHALQSRASRVLAALGPKWIKDANDKQIKFLKTRGYANNAL